MLYKAFIEFDWGCISLPPMMLWSHGLCPVVRVCRGIEKGFREIFRRVRGSWGLWIPLGGTENAERERIHSGDLGHMKMSIYYHS